MADSLALASFPALLEPGMRVFIPGASNEPTALIRALEQAPAAARGVTFVQFPLPGMNRTDFTGLHEQARMESFFLSPALRDAFAAGRVDFIPLHLRRVYDHVARCEPFDLVLLQAGRDADGRLRHGFNVDFVEAAMRNGRRIVVAVNRSLRPPVGAPALAPEHVDWLVEVDEPLPALSREAPGAIARAIGGQVAALVPDGACMQTGIGAIPTAVLGALTQKNDLGWHSGLLDDAALELIERGVMTGAAKCIDRRVHVTAMAIGTQRLYDALAERDDVELRPARYTHEAAVITELDRFISVNSAVEVDLLGQVAAEMVAGRQISGTGGSVDFMRGAATSPGGRSIVAMTATARRGELSRIVPSLAAGTAVTAPRTDVDCVVTEHGVAELRGRSIDARAEALIEVAAPEFRDALHAAWREQRARM